MSLSSYYIRSKEKVNRTVTRVCIISSSWPQPMSISFSLMRAHVSTEQWATPERMYFIHRMRMSIVYARDTLNTRFRMRRKLSRKTYTLYHPNTHFCSILIFLFLFTRLWVSACIKHTSRRLPYIHDFIDCIFFLRSARCRCNHFHLYYFKCNIL